MRKTFAGWALLLLGAIAAAAMVPQFAVFIPFVALTWLLARMGVLRRLLSHRHSGARLVPGPDAPVTTVSATLEAEPASGPCEKEMLGLLVARADALGLLRLGPEGADVVAWGEEAGDAPESRSAAPPTDLETQLRAWPEIRSALSAGARLVLSTRRGTNGPKGVVRRVDACLAGDRRLLERCALEAAHDMRRAGVEVVTTGWLRHAERVQAGRGSRSART